MWTRSYSIIVKDVSLEVLWTVWSDVNQWHTWKNNIQFAKIEGAFETGNSFVFKPKSGLRLVVGLPEVNPNKNFITATSFLGATMCDNHELIERADGIEVKITINIDGILSWVWRKIVAEGVVAGLPGQTEAMIARALKIQQKN